MLTVQKYISDYVCSEGEGSLYIAQMVKSAAEIQRPGSVLVGSPREVGKVHSSIIWRNPMDEEANRSLIHGVERVGHDAELAAYTHAVRKTGWTSTPQY